MGTEKFSKGYIRDRELGGPHGPKGEKGSCRFLPGYQALLNQKARNSATITCFSLKRDYQSLVELRIEGDIARWRAEFGAAEVPGN